MDKKDRLLRRVNMYGCVTAAEAESMGVSRRYLYKLNAQGILDRPAKGVFTGKDWHGGTEHSSIVEAVSQVGECVVSLLSALRVHGITTQAPHEVWLSIPRGRRKSRVQYPPVHYTTVSPGIYPYGIKELRVGRFRFQVYSPARTVADCFRFRNQVGLDVAIEALRETWRSRKATMDEIAEAAEVCRVLKVMKPYMEATV